ncbi:hypothetical protein [Merismopedia glauca]|uniref:Uncharacterized protein n=1 Tax=Merismopedia glauca CCAP 1448/3 TaxID=1296344 RepID=A0A2T1C186_9CYAN|nr:hypothetical protein [Merismopedia glauca]PSB02029.1 hypothetical protein C7B64_15125 [Merismopedia glauca CCAP 1448/3]
MNFKTIVLTTTLLASSAIALSSPAFATTYAGGGYTVNVDDGEGSSLSYHACDPKGRCLYINRVSSYSSHPERYVWRNQGYRYILTQTSKPNRYRLQVFNPKGKLVLNRLLTNLDYHGGF